jgi:prepilin-type N-terminal cleavage/methylation domain-containing protein
MLKINKILSKKVKFPLSLRGLFPFCHSRESGNPSFLSFRGVKQQSNLNHNGFSLIELMIAITILALAIFGIFHAYSVGFLGMADARDRTVATNYAREAMEDVKNMDFELVTNENLGTAESVGEKFTRVISVNTENGNLKKITTLVYWNNRNGKTINIKTSMYINRTLFNPGEAVKIVLYANPYYAVLPSAGVANIIAVIKDKNGNTKIDWTGGNIRFSITDGSEFGFLPDGAYTPGVEPTNGQAVTIFTGSAEGDVVIEASVTLPDGSTVSDTITIAVTLDVVRIELLAVPDRIDADGTSTSTITAALKNSGDSTVITATNIITFNISGKGTFVDYSDESPLPNTITIAPSDGKAYIKVKSITDEPGVATVTASSEGLLSDTVNIKTIGDATSIFVSVEPNLIYEGDNARVTVEIQDINGNPVEYTEPITLSISDGTGNFTDNPVGPDTTPLAYSTFFSPTSLGILTITASGGDLVDGITTIEVGSVLIADTITIKAVPKNILAGGEVDSKITATIKQGSTVISNYNNEITFEIFSDTSSLQDALLYFNSDLYGIIGQPFTVTGEQYGNDGEAVVHLNPASYVGICTIEVSTVNSLGTLIKNTVEVGFYSGEDHIDLISVPSKMLVNGETCTVTATVVDEGGTPVDTYNEDITFTILVGWPKIAKFAVTGTTSLTKTLVEGKIPVVLISQSKAGTVTLKASSFTGVTDIIGYLNIPVDINFIDLVPDSVSYSPEGVKNIVSFDIDVQGAELLLEEMKVSWLPYNSETLNKIEIRSPNTADPITIFDNSDFPAFSGDIINVNDIILSTGESNVKIYFNQDISGKNILDVTFNPNSGDYTVNLIP